ncbi:hypothetical protein KRX56_06250 [Dermabacteraceae bacterium TAE3-ERU27]|nr:hypothetical protein [Dermabacteraceae bacterium TAE3-ERU27]
MNEELQGKFVETKRLLQELAAEMGEKLSSRRAHFLAEACFSIWSGEAMPLLVNDPTGEEAVRRVMALHYTA